MAACINLDLYIYSEAYSETCQISTMELFAKYLSPIRMYEHFVVRAYG